MDVREVEYLLGGPRNALYIRLHHSRNLAFSRTEDFEK